ncbi:MAG: hypothetical protein HY422_00980 [Candidatus Komeilibacteria bacterium]|nr:hypothetical protein [Candidatus Komeilibacteria bacterium]
MKNKKRPVYVWCIVAVYATGMLVLILLSASNYPVQWRAQVNHERQRYLEVFDQAISYYSLDHAGVIFPLPDSPAMISNTDQCSYACPALKIAIPCYDLSRELVPSYMSRLYQDPLLTSESDTGFYVYSRDGILNLGACHHFFKDPIGISRKL